MMMLDRKPLGTIGALVCAALVAAACDKAPLFAPSQGATPSTITVTTSTLVVPVGGSAEIQAFVVEPAGTPVQNGTSVLFSATLGALNPAEALTRDGIARTTFTATISGTSQITAASGTAKTATPVEIRVGAAAVAATGVSVRAVPGAVSSTGGTVELIATVVAEGGRLLSNVPVSFSATRGALGATLVVTDVSGEARTTLTTAEESRVIARAGTVASPELVVAARTGPSVTLTCAVGATTNCATVGQGQVVTFTASRGTTTSNIVSARLEFGDGESVALGSLSGPTTVAHIYSSAGTFTARLIAADAAGEQTTATQVVQVRNAVGVTLQLERDGRTVTARASISGATASDVQQYAFTFEGGSPASFNTTSDTASSTYSTAGLKTVSVTVTFRDGRTATNSAQIALQ